MDQVCDICQALIPEGSLYGQFSLTIERMKDHVVYVEDAKAITTLCLSCAQEFNSFEDAKRLLD